jgi:hypothetical protein
MPSPASVIRRAPSLAVAGGFAAWIGATAASQHPQRAFDRLRERDPLGLLVPNWRFFAPEPAKHDFHLLHRVLGQDGTASEWRETTRIAPRRSTHAAWFPERRRDKAVFDICNELIMLLAIPTVDLPATAPFGLLRDAVEVQVRREHAEGELPKGFQFLVARHTGHEDGVEPDYLFASPFQRLGADDRAEPTPQAQAVEAGSRRSAQAVVA